MHRSVTLLLTTAAFGCAYRVTDLPTVAPRSATGDRLFVLANAQGRDTSGWVPSGRLAADLEAAGFVPVIVPDERSVPDGAPIIQISRSSRSCFAEPMLTVLTIGVIPHFGCQAYGHNLLVQKAAGSAYAEVDASFRVRYMVGWFTWPAVLSPNYANDFSDRFARLQEVNLLRATVQDSLK